MKSDKIRWDQMKQEEIRWDKHKDHKVLNKINPPHLSTDGLPLHQLPEFRGNALEALRALYTVLSGDLRRGSEVAKGLRILRISAEFYIHSIPICISYNIISIHIMCICKINYILVELYNYIYNHIYIYVCVFIPIIASSWAASPSSQSSSQSAKTSSYFTWQWNIFCCKKHPHIYPRRIFKCHAKLTKAKHNFVSAKTVWFKSELPKPNYIPNMFR